MTSFGVSGKPSTRSVAAVPVDLGDHLLEDGPLLAVEREARLAARPGRERALAEAEIDADRVGAKLVNERVGARTHAAPALCAFATIAAIASATAPGASS